MKNTTTSLPTSSKKTKKKQALKTPEIQSISNYNNKNQFYPISKNNIPKLRFNKFENNWNVYIFKDILDIISGYGFKMNEYSSNGVPLIKINNIGYGNILIDDMDYLPEDYLEKYPNLVLNKNDILLALNRPITNNKLKIALLKNEDVPSILYQRVGKIILKNDNLYYLFIYYLLQEKIFKFILKNSKGSDQPFISTNELKKIELKIPSLKEQKKIGNFLSRIDKKLFLMEQRFIQLNKCKLSMLQGMIVKSAYDKEVPNIRFNEFKHKWTTIKLKEITDRITTKNRNLDSNLVLTISAEYGLIDQEKYFNKSVASKNLKNYYLLEKGDFAYNKSYSNGHPYGVVKKLNQYNKGIVSTLYICFKPKHFINPNFLEQYFKTSVWNKEIYKIATEGARNHGLLNIGVEDFFNTKHKIPPTYKEQEKIASFLSTIDDKIKITKKKIDLMKTYKQGLVQKMFV